MQRNNKKLNYMKNETDISPGAAFADKLMGSSVDNNVRKKILAAYRRGRIDGRNEAIEELHNRRNAPLSQKRWWEN